MKLVQKALFTVGVGLLTAAGGVASTLPGVNSQTILDQARNLRPQVLELALKAYTRAADEGVVRRPVLTIIDYQLPSYEKRLWVIDMKSGRVLLDEWVAHGMGRPCGSGGTMIDATSFSNQAGSRRSSLGLFITAETYPGRHGYSLRLDGLEPGINDKARRRLIVIHGAGYVSPDRARQHLVGRSWGCPAVRPGISRRLIDAIKGGSVVWIYFPDRSWLASSRFLHEARANNETLVAASEQPPSRPMPLARLSSGNPSEDPPETARRDP